MVKQFTEESLEIPTPDSPSKMSYDEVKFLIRMLLSEIVELGETVTNSPKEALEFVQSCFGADAHTEIPVMESEEDVVAEQVDAVVDILVYSLNACAKKGMNIDLAFSEVHRANMDKRDHVTNRFNRRATDGKILKPDGWIAPDIKSVLFSKIEKIE